MAFANINPGMAVVVFSISTRLSKAYQLQEALDAHMPEAGNISGACEAFYAYETDEISLLPERFNYIREMAQSFRDGKGYQIDDAVIYAADMNPIDMAIDFVTKRREVLAKSFIRST